MLFRSAAQLLNKDRTDLYRSIDRVFFLSMALAVPAALALVILAEPIVSVLFERGAFGSADRIGTAMALAGFVVGLPFAAIGRVQTQLYFAHERIRVPLFAVLFSNLLIVGCLHLSLFSHSLFVWALAFSLGQLALCVVQHLGLTSLTGWTPDPVFRMKLYKILAASGLMGFALLFLNDHYGAALLADRGGVWRWAGLTAFCATGLGIYAAAIYFFWIMAAVSLRCSVIRLLRSRFAVVISGSID